MSTTTESHSPARGNGLTQVLSKARRGRNKNNADTISVVSNGSDGSHGRRGKLEGAMDRQKNGEGSDDDDGDQGGLKKLLPKAIVSKKRRKKEEKDSEIRATEEVGRGRSVAERCTLENDSAGNSMTADGDGSSLITYESENEEYVHLHTILHFNYTVFTMFSSIIYCFLILRAATRLRSEGPKRRQRSFVSPYCQISYIWCDAISKL
jgi:hypothetical protein